MQLTAHPTVKKVLAARPEASATRRDRLDADWLRGLCLDAGADDVGFVEIARPGLEDQRADLLRVFPATRALIAFVCKMNREPIRSPARSVSNVEFHQTGEHVNAIAHGIVRALEERGIRAVNPAMGFPMEMDRFPGKVWVVSHKPVAVEAGLGRMGIHRNVIHPRFGNFVLLGTILVEAEVSAYGAPLDFNPCLECKLCVAACPVGAIGADGHFAFSACSTHNYREFMGGFSDWVEQIASSDGAADYRRRVTLAETASMWQSLGFGPNYKAAYCMAVCPAGEDVIGPFLADRPAFLKEVLEPLQQKTEPVYVVPGSDAEQHVARRFPHKRARRVSSGLRPTSLRGFLAGLPLTFQRGQAAGLDATYHFVFTQRRGLRRTDAAALAAQNAARPTEPAEPTEATVVIRDRRIEVSEGLHGTPDVRIAVDRDTWLGILARERSLLAALLTLRMRVRGPVRLLKAFGRCFPG